MFRTTVWSKINTNSGDKHCEFSHFDVSYANAKTHNFYHRCLCFIFDQTTMALELLSSVTNEICHKRKQNKHRGTFKNLRDLIWTFYVPLNHKNTSVTSGLTFNMFTEWNDSWYLDHGHDTPARSLRCKQESSWVQRLPFFTSATGKTQGLRAVLLYVVCKQAF